MPKSKLLIVEDDPGMQKQLRWVLDDYEVLLAATPQAALAELRRHRPPVVTIDLGLPPETQTANVGLALLRDMLASAPGTKIVVLTAQRQRDSVLQAVGMGAYDYHEKPLDPRLLQMVVQRALFLHTVQAEHGRMLQIGPDRPLAGIVSRDPAMLALCRTLEKVAPSQASVLLLGESGCGKELLARGLHALSPRRAGRFVAINCAAIPEALLESELFGYEKGAYTGAVASTPGKIELAAGGTLFLDEVGDLAPAMQGKLLRFLQERVIERLGGRSPAEVDVRVVCATNRRLRALVDAGGFREDLYYRLQEIVLDIPPLRERVGDALLLASHFRNRYCALMGRPAWPFRPEALAAVEAHGWPGNVRELENCVRRAVILTDGPALTEEDLGLAPAGDAAPDSLDLRQAREAAEYRVMVKALGKVGGNVLRAAELLGVSRPTLYGLMNQHGIR